MCSEVVQSEGFSYQIYFAMYYTTNRLEGFYSFAHVSGKAFRTRFSPREIAHRYCFDAMDEKGNLKVVLTEEVDFRSFEYIRLQNRQR